mgnify:CR=1 FL=1
MKTYRLFFVSVYRFIWNTFLYDISSILLIIIFKLYLLSTFPNLADAIDKATIVIITATGIHGKNSIALVERSVDSFPYSEVMTKNG